MVRTNYKLTETDINEDEFMDSLKMFLAKKSSFPKLNAYLRKNDWNPVSKSMVIIGLIGTILTIFCLFFYVLWFIAWIYCFFTVIMLGFLLAKPESSFKFNIVPVFFIFMAFALIPSKFTQLVIGNPTATLDVSEDQFYDLFDQQTRNPMFREETTDINVMARELQVWVFNLNNTLNWIIFIGILAAGGITIADFFSMQYDKGAKKIAMIALAIVVITFVYGLFKSAGLPVRDVWDTLGGAWEDMLEAVGLKSSGETYTTEDGQDVNTDRLQHNIFSGTIFEGILGMMCLDIGGHKFYMFEMVNGLFRWIPLMFSIGMLAFGRYTKHQDLESIMFLKSVRKKHLIRVKMLEMKGFNTIGSILLIIISGVYIIGYFLFTANPDLMVNSNITFAFYIVSFAIFILIIMQIPIFDNSGNPLVKCVYWIFAGLLLLFGWFLVFQPFLYNLNLISEESTLLIMSQSAFESDILEQLFLVALPETLIFQISFVGIGNRFRFIFGKGAMVEKQKKSLESRYGQLAVIYDDIPLDYDDKKNIVVSKSTLKNVIKSVAIEREMELIERTIEGMKVQEVSVSSFIGSTLVSAVIGSFFFSWFHSARRGVSFIDWWQNPYLGITYFGAGVLLSIVAFFSPFAAIIIHWLNNLLSLLLSGG